MTPQQAQLLLPVIEAYAKGKVVQWGYAENPQTVWNDYEQKAHVWQVNFCNPTLQWRIKPEPPTPREWLICFKCNVLNTTGNKCWRCELPLTRVREVLPVEGREMQS